MALFTWKIEYSVGVNTFDAHHRMLIELMNIVHDAVAVGKHQSVMGKILRELNDYTNYHFESEERLMQAHRYPEYSQHKLQHDSFVAKVRECISKYKDGSLNLILELLNFLTNWLKTHIMDADKKITQFLRDKNIALN